MTETRKGLQTPTNSVILPYKKTDGEEAVRLYNSTGRKALEWQELLLYDILARNDDGLWTHSKFGYQVSRRNGKNEVIVMREAEGLKNGECILHTAHQTDTAHAAWERLMELLPEMGIDITSSFRALGRENIRVEGGGRIEFRTRTRKSGLGQGYDLLVVDEAQEYTLDQESALLYVVSASPNPQTILCGTPPTVTSAGTVFTNLREEVLAGKSVDTGWAEWSVERQMDPLDKDAWYQTNPSLGYFLTERAIAQEITGNDLDFNIQRLGYWVRYNLKSAFSRTEWDELQVSRLPKLKGKIFVGIKYGHDGVNTSMSIAVKTEDDRIFTECIDCVPTRDGNEWILKFLQKADIGNVVVDGANGQRLLADEMKANKLKSPIMPKTVEVINACATFEQLLYAKRLCHNGQPSMTLSITNCEKRAIGTNGGFGFKSIRDEVDVSILESVALAVWICNQSKEKKKQKISY